MSDIQTEAGSAGVPDQSPGEQRAADLMAQNDAQAAREYKLSPTTESVPGSAPEPDIEPELTKLIRFEAGTVHELMEHIKTWVDWRIAGGKSAAPEVPVADDTTDTGATKIGGGAIYY